MWGIVAADHRRLNDIEPDGGRLVEDLGRWSNIYLG